MSKFLFHPKITLTAGLTAIGSFCAVLAGLSGALVKVPHGDTILTAAEIVGPLAIWVATYGRSPASSVDNNTPKDPA